MVRGSTRRRSARDCEQALALPQLLALYQEKYERREIGHVLTALSYFEDAEREPEPETPWDVDWATVKASIRRWVRSFVGT